MKVDSKHIQPFIETLKALLEDASNSFPECDEREQVIDVFDYVHEQIKSVLTEFKIEHLTPPLKAKNSLPDFVQIRDRFADSNINEGRDIDAYQNDYEEKIHFMAKMYFIIKRKIENDGVERCFTEERIRHHIYHYLLYNDDNINYYFNSVLAEALHKVVDRIVDEIIEALRKAPQMQLDLEIKPEEKSKRLIDNL